jgi:type II secretory pathway predicted ATPase ExeA
MQDGCFNLVRRPFASLPQVDDYYPGSGIENAHTAIARCIQRGEGTALVIGPSGTGKTLLCLVLAKQFEKTFRVAMLPSGRLSTRRALFQAILYELGRPYRGMDEGELRLAVVDELTAAEKNTSPLLLLVDEAHVLPLRLLSELRLLTNLARNGQPLVRLVLAGGPILEERFANPKLDAFNQRLAARCYLASLNRTETQEYICHQINYAGGPGETLFSEEACQSIFQATGGVPRLINQLCDHALILVSVSGLSQITPINIEEAWADLQQLPMPWSGETKSEEEGGVIEFGSLDDFGESTSTSHSSSNASESPSLRISSNLDDDSDFGEPSQQIHRIEQLLAEADGDFQPAGSITPEIDIHFEETPHPFLEEFEHEEVINDRYAVQRSASFSRLDSCMASIFNAGSGAENVSTQKTPMESAPDSKASMPLGKPMGDRGMAIEPPTTPAIPPYSKPVESFSDRESPIYGSEMSSTTAGYGNHIDDVNQPPIHSVPNSPPKPMRSHEFRTLFARLRRG